MAKDGNFQCFCLKDHFLRIGAQEIPLKKSKGETPPSCCRAVLSKDVSIPHPPLSETIIPVRINDANTDSDHEWRIMESMRPTANRSRCISCKYTR